MQQPSFLLTFTVFTSIINVFVTETTELSLAPVVRRWKRHCGNQGCAPSVCQECPQCCGAPAPGPYNPVFNINFNCCRSPRPSPSCCSAPPPPPPPPAQSCCSASPVPSPCCPAPPSPVTCCKAAPVPENPCCQVIANIPAPPPASPSCCAAAPVPANPCCQPAPPPSPCSCSAPRPVPCRCAPPPMTVDCPNCDMPALRCSSYSPMGCNMRRMRRDVHEQILKTFHSYI